jgi:trehalose 6-phosphate synthase
VFRSGDWEQYCAVNEKFCRAVLEEAAGEPAIVFIQDYQLGLLSRLLRNQRPDLILAQFWHIPWPNREAFRIFPWGEQLLDGLLGNDLLGFHIQYHCNNFMDTVDRGIEARVDYEHFRIYRGGRPTSIRPFPISVDFMQIGSDAQSDRVGDKIEEFKTALGSSLGAGKLFVGADRIDYTKGIPERLQAFDMLLQKHPELRGKVTLMQLSAPSRMHLDAYRDLNDRIEDLVDDINWRHQTDEWQPIHFLRAHHDYYAMLAAYKMADALLVTSLHDGMNLVAKEFISARCDERGVLVLSRYTGAARELPEALQANPFDIEDLAQAMYLACCMPEAEIGQRMSRLREQVAKENVYAWGARIFDEIRKIRQA